MFFHFTLHTFTLSCNYFGSLLPRVQGYSIGTAQTIIPHVKCSWGHSSMTHCCQSIKMHSCSTYIITSSLNLPHSLFHHHTPGAVLRTTRVVICSLGLGVSFLGVCIICSNRCLSCMKARERRQDANG